MFPVTYISKKLTEREKRFSTIERKCLAIVWSVKKLRTYLYGRQFVLQNRSPAPNIPQASKISEQSSDALGAIFTELPHED